jgi:hypothetical protein
MPFGLSNNLGDIIQMSGDQRIKVKEFVTANQIASSDKIKVHGF